MKFWLPILFLLVACFVFHSPVYGGETPPPPVQLNCSTIIYSYAGYEEDPHNCNQWQWTLFLTYKHNFDFNWSCYTTGQTVSMPAGTTYASGSKTLPATAQCSYFFVTGVLNCPARYQVTKHVPISYGNGLNTMTWTAQPGYITAPSNCANSTGTVVQATCVTQGCYTTGSSPIVIDLDDKGFATAFTTPADGADWNWGGHILKTSWPRAERRVGILVLLGPDGVHDASQMFGNFTPQPPIEFPNGFNALLPYDAKTNGGNNNRRIDKGDPVFDSLRVWVGRPVCRPDRSACAAKPEDLHTLEEVGITSIFLDYELDSLVVIGAHLRFRGHVSGPLGDHTIYDAFFEDYCPPKT